MHPVESALLCPASLLFDLDMEALSRNESGGAVALCSVVELLTAEIVLAVERSLLWLLLAMGSLSSQTGPLGEGSEEIYGMLRKSKQEAVPEIKDDGESDDDDGDEDDNGEDGDDQEDGGEADLSGEENENKGDEDDDDPEANGAGGSEEEDEDDDEDDDEEEDDDDEDEEEEDDEDDEELPQPPTKKRK